MRSFLGPKSIVLRALFLRYNLVPISETQQADLSVFEKAHGSPCDLVCLELQPQYL